MADAENRKRDWERFLFEEFLRVSPQISLTEISQLKPPAPDILVMSEGRQIGIEITRYLRASEKQKESDQERCLALARREYDKRGNPEVGVMVCWNFHKSIQKGTVNDLAMMISAFVGQNLPVLGQFHECEPQYPSTLAEYVDHVSIERLPYRGAHLWSAGRSGCFPTIEPEDIRSLVATKEPLITGYRQFCAEAWLLIVSEGDPSSWAELSEATVGEMYSTDFDRLFFLTSTPRTSTELATHK